jgi:hypothetical protein
MAMMRLLVRVRLRGYALVIRLPPEAFKEKRARHAVRV